MLTFTGQLGPMRAAHCRAKGVSPGNTGEPACRGGEMSQSLGVRVMGRDDMGRDCAMPRAGMVSVISNRPC